MVLNDRLSCRINGKTNQTSNEEEEKNKSIFMRFFNLFYFIFPSRFDVFLLVSLIKIVKMNNSFVTHLHE